MLEDMVESMLVEKEAHMSFKDMYFQKMKI